MTIIRVGNVVGECICGHQPCDGLDCGVYLSGRAPRRKPAPKLPEEMADIRARAWATRRIKYGSRGHR